MTSRAGRSTVVPLGDMADYDGDTSSGDERRPPRSKQIKNRLKRFRDVPGPTVSYSYVWSKPLMNSARYAAGFFSLVALVTLFWPIFFWLIGVMPPFPFQGSVYAVVFFFFMLPVYVVGVSVVWWMVVEYYALSACLQAMALVLSSYLFGAMWYKWIVCIDGSAAAMCVNSYYMDTIMLGVLGILWLAGLIATGAHLVIIFRASPADSVTKSYVPVGSSSQ